MSCLGRHTRVGGAMVNEGDKGRGLCHCVNLSSFRGHYCDPTSCNSWGALDLAHYMDFGRVFDLSPFFMFSSSSSRHEAVLPIRSTMDHHRHGNPSYSLCRDVDDTPDNFTATI